MVDMVVSRIEMKATVARLVKILLKTRDDAQEEIVEEEETAPAEVPAPAEAVLAEAPSQA